MESTKVSHKKAENHEPLKGTWISCGVVGGVILVTYLIVYGLYMVRV
ncbi:cytochrome c oxidase subunit 2A [Neobacillus thermocopriae]|uniref:Cytochrome c oxidase subunit 2A n=1 Tax=Neobacillus thermocopriae TaxID=1215031 RepID=A0A6B3TPX8_9BACI|nr:cytochrome c oxidase subunit 2A [Neobacillus thermocopriae]MED3622641.1 cytochrome c oxidase subunit 2A [Neobacillus thermocopriae]MED3714268.1 cytochrome c oxidase subunit 2A [Neobacillus thermocopriae]NEX77807.1 cytochrome c oxidase subunit 2A [Neobacillus thermocopriae]